jgi:hypothetical protein
MFSAKESNDGFFFDAKWRLTGVSKSPFESKVKKGHSGENALFFTIRTPVRITQVNHLPLTKVNHGVSA